MATKKERLQTIVEEKTIVFVELSDGAVQCSAIVFDRDELTGRLIESCAALALQPEKHCENDEILSLRFKPYALLDYLVDGHAIYGNRKLLNKDAKPCIEQLRNELQAMIDEIDGLAYTNE